MEPINELLLYILSQERDQLDIESIAPLSQSDWDALLVTARKHRVIPLLYWQVRPFVERIPESIAQALKNTFHKNTFDNMRLYHELKNVLPAFRAAKIPVIVLKGAYLAQLVYSNIGLRTMRDVDLLVPKEDLGRAKDEMLALGYHLPQEISLSEQHLPPFYKADNKRIEIHWTILPDSNPFALDIEDLWERAQPVKIAKMEALALSPEDLLLHLILHASYQHRFVFGIRPFYDIALTIRHYEKQLNWEEFRKRADKWQVNKPLYLTLLLAQGLFSPPIPSAHLSSLKPASFDPQLLQLAKAQLFADRRQQLLITRQIARFWGAQHLREQAHFLSQSLFLPKDVMARLYSVRASSPKLYFYYLERLRYLLFQHGASLLRLLWQPEQQIVVAANREKVLLEWLESPEIER